MVLLTATTPQRSSTAFNMRSITSRIGPPLTQENALQQPGTGQADTPLPSTAAERSDQFPSLSGDASNHSPPLDIPRPTAGLPLIVPAYSPGSRASSVIDIRSTLAMVDALKAEDLTSHPEMPFALIARLFQVAGGDTRLLTVSCRKLLTLSTNPHAMACVLASFREAARQYLPGHSIKALIALLYEFASQVLEQDMRSIFDEYLLPLHATLKTDVDVGVPQIAGNPMPWDIAWTVSILNPKELSRQQALGIDTPSSLVNMARPMARVAMLSRKLYTRYKDTLAGLRWTYRLSDMMEFGPRNPYPPGIQIARSIGVLVDMEAYPEWPQARAQHTLALMIAAGDRLPELYMQLHARVVEGTGLAPHMDWDLPPPALVAASLAFDIGTPEFDELGAEILGTLPSFSEEAQAQFYADLCALLLACERPEYVDSVNKLKALGTASEAQLHKLEILVTVFHAPKNTAADLAGVAPLLDYLLLPHDHWTLFSMIALRFLSLFHEKNWLTPDQVDALVDRATEFVRHFMSLARPDLAGDHPLIHALDFLGTRAAIAPAFRQKLQDWEKARFLQTLYGYAPAFVDELVEDVNLPDSEKVLLIDKLLKLEGISGELADVLDEVLRDLKAAWSGPL